MKGVEASSGHDELAGDGLSEDRGEEDGIGAIAASDLNLGEGVAGDGDDGVGKTKAGVATTDVVGQQGGTRGKVNSVGTALKSCLKTAIDEEAGGGGFGCDGRQDLGGEIGYVAWEEVFLAKLDQVDPHAGPQGALLNEGRLSLGFVAGKEGAVGDGAAEHVDKCSSREQRFHVVVGLRGF